MKKSLSLIALLTISMIFTTGLLQADDGWTTNYAKALAQAKAEKKMVLVDFTGSDWCPWCQKLDKEVFAEPKFQDYAKKNLILVTVDFPQGKEQSAELKKQNADLQDKFAIQGYPTVVVLSPDGKKVGELGYQPGGAEAFLAELAKVPKQ
jgi:thioredoxin-related protein